MPIDFQPPRARLTTAILVLLPFALFFIHAALLGASASIGFLVLMGAGTIGATVISVTPRLRALTDVELTKSRLLRVVVCTVLVLAEGAAGAVVIPDGLAQGRIEAALSSADPCIEPAAADLSAYGDDGQRGRRDERGPKCEAQRQAARCAQLIAAIDRVGKTMPDVKNAATAGVAQRIGAGTIVRADLGLSKTDLVCGDAVWTRLVSVAARTPAVWGGSARPTVSDDMVASLAAIGLSSDAQEAVRSRTESTAEAVLKKATTAGMWDAKAACDQAISCNVGLGPSCDALEKRFATIAAREAAAKRAKDDREAAVAKAKDDREAAMARARDDRCKRIEALRNMCFERICLNLDANDPRNDDCNDACERKFPAPDCD